MITSVLAATWKRVLFSISCLNVYLRVSLSVCKQPNLKVGRPIFIKLGVRVECQLRANWLDFEKNWSKDEDQDHKSGQVKHMQFEPDLMEGLRVRQAKSYLILRRNGQRSSQGKIGWAGFALSGSFHLMFCYSYKAVLTRMQKISILFTKTE